MEPSLIGSQMNDFDERNAFLYLLLGLVSLSTHFLHRLETAQDRQNHQHNSDQEGSRTDTFSAADWHNVLI